MCFCCFYGFICDFLEFPSVKSSFKSFFKFISFIAAKKLVLQISLENELRLK